jgi:hypothetical protein
MANQKWNRNHWQGRSKIQVEANYKVCCLFFKTFACLFIVYIIWTVLEDNVL